MQAPQLTFEQLVIAWLGNRKMNCTPEDPFLPTSCLNRIDKKGKAAPTLRVNVLKHRSFVRLHFAKEDEGGRYADYLQNGMYGAAALRIGAELRRVLTLVHG